MVTPVQSSGGLLSPGSNWQYLETFWGCHSQGGVCVAIMSGVQAMDAMEFTGSPHRKG